MKSIFIWFTSSFEIVSAVMHDPNTFLWVVTSVDDAAAVNPNGIKTYLTFIKGNPVFTNSSKSLPKNPPIVLFYSNEFLIILY